MFSTFVEKRRLSELKGVGAVLDSESGVPGIL
jgi:hypothetical protein